MVDVDNIRAIFAGLLDGIMLGGLKSPHSIVKETLELGERLGHWLGFEFEEVEERDTDKGKVFVFLVGLRGIAGADSCYFRFNVLEGKNAGLRISRR